MKEKRDNVENRGNIISPSYFDQSISNEGDENKVNKSSKTKRITYSKGENVEHKRRIAKEDNEQLFMFKRKNLSYVDK